MQKTGNRRRFVEIGQRPEAVTVPDDPNANTIIGDDSVMVVEALRDAAATGQRRHPHRHRQANQPSGGATPCPTAPTLDASRRRPPP